VALSQKPPEKGAAVRPTAKTERHAESGMQSGVRRPACCQAKAKAARQRRCTGWKKDSEPSEGPLCSLMRGLWLKWHLAAASPRGGHPTPPPTPLTPTPLGRGATN
jgi:hypothetical protein